MTNPNTELAARRARMDMAVAGEPKPLQLVDVQAAIAPDLKSFRGSYLLYRQKGKGMERMKGSTPRASATRRARRPRPRRCGFSRSTRPRRSWSCRRSAG